MPLTVTQCRNAIPKEKPYKLSDGNGLRLSVQPSGGRLWQLAYRFGGKQKTLSLGPFPDVTLAEARTAASTARQQLRAGHDPMKPLNTSAGRTFEEVFEELFAIWEPGKSPVVIRRERNRMRDNVIPYIGAMAIETITPADIVALIRRVEARGALDTSWRVKQKCGEVFGYAIAMEYTQADPTARLNRVLRPKPSVVHMPMVPLAELPKLLADIDAYALSPIARLALKFTMLTATRTTEAREARWDEVDTKAAVWRIPPERMKMRREHLVPLSRQALALIEEIRKRRRGDHLFPGPRRPVMNTNAMLYALYDMGYRHRQTVHGFRRLFSTVLNESGRFKEDWIEVQLAHDEDDQVRKAYNAAQYLPQRVEMMQWWADRLDAEMGFENLLG